MMCQSARISTSDVTLMMSVRCYDAFLLEVSHIRGAPHVRGSLCYNAKVIRKSLEYVLERDGRV